MLFSRFDVDLEIWVRGHSRSLKLVSFKSLGAVSYSPSRPTVTMALDLVSSADCTAESLVGHPDGR